MPRKTAAEKAAEEAAAAEEARRRTERQRLTWAGMILAAVGLFGVGYLVGNAGDGDAVIGSDAVAAPTRPGPSGGVVPGDLGQVPDRGPGRGGGAGQGPGDGRPDRTPPAGQGSIDLPPTHQPGYLGVGVQQTPDGVLIVEVADDGPAATSGFEVGDVIIGFDGDDVDTVRDFARAVRRAGATTEVEIVVLRGGDEVILTPTLASIPD